MAVPGQADPGAGSRRVAGDGLVVDVVPLLRWPGNQCEVHLHQAMDDVSTSAAEACRVDGILTVESMPDSLTVTGALDLAWTGACRRCMEPTEGTTVLELREVFEKSPVEGETYELSADQLDLGPMIREAVLLGLPLAPLCSDGCEGPAPHVYPAVVQVETPPEPERDPRWAALDQIVFDD